jgi:DNA modification methylase
MGCVADLLTIGGDMRIIQGDSLEVLKTLPDESVDCVITSPPYWALRDYGCEGQLGLEPTFQEYIDKLCNIFDEAKRVLKKEGTCWVNIGDTYMNNSSYSVAGRQGFNNDKSGMIYKKDKDVLEKSLCQIPSRFAIEMTNRGWILRNEIIWHKPNCMPSSVEDRFTVDFEKVFFFVKSKKYYFEQILEPYESEPSESDRNRNKAGEKYNGTGLFSEGERDYYCKGGRNKRTVWSITTKGFSEAHFATYPEALVEPMIKSGCPLGGIVLDPFSGSGTTGRVAIDNGREYIGIELNPEYIKIQEKRLMQTSVWEQI